MTYRIIQTGSSGNAVLYHQEILVDCGVSYKKLAPFTKYIKWVLLTHEHTDHVNIKTLNKLIELGVGIVTPPHMVEMLMESGIGEYTVIEKGEVLSLGDYKIATVNLYHNVPNVGYRILGHGLKYIHMTDTETYEGIVAKGYDLYMLEGNYCEDYIHVRIQEQHNQGVGYIHGYRSLRTHASIQQAERYFDSMKSDKSKLVLLHGSDEYRKGNL